MSGFGAPSRWTMLYRRKSAVSIRYGQEAFGAHTTNILPRGERRLL